jgi:hypothetical protein
MSSSASRVFAVGFATAGLAAILGGCSTDDGGGLPPGGSTAGVPGTSGTNNGTSGGNNSGSPSTGGSGAGNAPVTAGAAGAAPTSGAGGAGTAGAGGGNSAGAGGDPTGDITKVAPTPGCGKDPPPNGKITIGTMGVKAADCAAKLNGQPRCGPWGQAASTWAKEPLPRDYYLYLPQGYDKTKAYPLVLLGPGCGGNGSDIYDYNDSANNTVIRVGVTPADRNIVGHGTNPGEDCFDDKEGDDSVDWV